MLHHNLVWALYCHFRRWLADSGLDWRTYLRAGPHLWCGTRLWQFVWPNQHACLHDATREPKFVSSALSTSSCRRHRWVKSSATSHMQGAVHRKGITTATTTTQLHRSWIYIGINCRLDEVATIFRALIRVTWFVRFVIRFKHARADIDCAIS